MLVVGRDVSETAVGTEVGGRSVPAFQSGQQ
jgi:hypothetical protein